jgi:DNA-binding beta-propeller fold protein YncE
MLSKMSIENKNYSTAMNSFKTHAFFTVLAAVALSGSHAMAQENAETHPYKIVNSAQMMGVGGVDYVYADNDQRRIYVPRGGETLVFDLDTLKSAGVIHDTKSAHGVAVDPKSHHGFSSSSPVVMWDSKTLETIKKIDVKGRPDGIEYEPLTQRIYVLSHSQPNATVIDAKDGSIVGTIDLGGSPEQGASDGRGHLYVDLEDKDSIAVVDVNTLKVTAHYDLGGKGGGPGGLGFDSKNNILFAFCHEPAVCVILNAEHGVILGTLPIGKGTDGGGFNPNTMEAFSSQGDGTLTIIKESSPTSFKVEQTVQTKPRAKTCTLDEKNNQIVLITLERPQTPSPADTAAQQASVPPQVRAAETAPGDNPGARRGRFNGPAMLDILVVGR